jgi:hypothetical protein
MSSPLPSPNAHGRARRSSIVDVAAVAGVSRQTVSNVLNGRREYYSQDTHDRVLDAMASLGYQPNRAAQSLRSRRSMQIGYHMFGQQLESVNGGRTALPERGGRAPGKPVEGVDVSMLDQGRGICPAFSREE